MMAGGDLERGRSFCILRGETVSGETIDDSTDQANECSLQPHMDHGERHHRQPEFQARVDSSR